MKKLSICFVLLAGLTAGFFVRDAQASRNSSGTYSLPSGNPVTTHTPISSTWANSTLADIGNELTNSLDRDGQGAMRAPLICLDGTENAPGLGFAGDHATGFVNNDISQSALNLGVVVDSNPVTSWDATQDTMFNMMPVKDLFTHEVGGNSILDSNETIAGNLTVGVDAGVGGNFEVEGKLTTGGNIGVGISANSSYRALIGGSVTAGDSIVAVGTGDPIFLRGNASEGAFAWNTTDIGSGEVFATSNYGAKWAYDALGTLRFFSSSSAGTGGASTSGNMVDRLDIDKLGVVTIASGSLAALTIKGLTIGTSGTAISSSVRGSASFTPGSISANSCLDLVITMSGLTAGADCAFGTPTFAVPVSVSCIVTSTTCGVQVCNPTGSPITMVSGTYSCRAFNP